MYIKKGDNIIVISGNNKGKKGVVIKAIPVSGKIIVEGVNVKKKNQKPRKSGEKGQIIEKAMPFNVSNAMLVDPKTGKQTRIGKKLVKDKFVRISKKSGQEF